MIPYNYHTHTYRCGHAVGSDEEYVLESIASGVRVLGFSDHIMLPNFVQPTIRGDYAFLEDYLNSINELKIKYADKIRILVGFEAEYAEEYLNYYKELLDSKKIEYLILGQHYEFRNKKIVHSFGRIQEKNELLLYRDLVIEGMKSGLFKIVAHPDLFMACYPIFDATAKKVANDICKASLRYDIPLEINLGGIRQGYTHLSEERRYIYPYLPFWEIAGKMKCKVVIGVDAHSPRNFRSNEYSIALKIIREFKLNHVKDFF